jgi:hypothetical protein
MGEKECRETGTCSGVIAEHRKRFVSLTLMPLFDMTDGALVDVKPTDFATERVLERTHLQAAIRDNILLLGGDLLVVAKEFGDFTDAHRRIDLLCIDRDARPVVVELKRTNDGGHMELQALRYAAMVSAMTFENLVSIFEKHLGSYEATGSFEARSQLAKWLEDVGGEDAVVRRDVRIILASADFGKEVMTTALWLNDVFGMDIRCVRMTPYRVQGRLLLNVEQVIPLPEAEEFMVKLRDREAATRGAPSSSRDYTRYVVTTPTSASDPLNKRRAVLAVVQAVHAAGATPAMIESVLPGRFLAVNGTLEGETLEDAFVAAYPKGDPRRWFFDKSVYHEGRNMGGVESVGHKHGAGSGGSRQPRRKRRHCLCSGMSQSSGRVPGTVLGERYWRGDRCDIREHDGRVCGQGS